MSSAQQGEKKSCFRLRVQLYQTLPAYLNPWATYYVQTEEFRVICSLLILHHCFLPVAVGSVNNTGSLSASMSCGLNFAEA